MVNDNKKHTIYSVYMVKMTTKYGAISIKIPQNQFYLFQTTIYPFGVNKNDYSEFRAIYTYNMT